MGSVGHYLNAQVSKFHSPEAKAAHREGPRAPRGARRRLGTRLRGCDEAAGGTRQRVRRGSERERFRACLAARFHPNMSLQVATVT